MVVAVSRPPDDQRPEFSALEEARAAGLRYVRDDMPGIRRVKAADGFEYLLPSGKRLNDEKQLRRIKALAIPPAWTDVWICESPTGHLQATGRDARGRKQYRYHAGWRACRDATKFERMIAFSEALPELRRRLARDQRLSGLPREKVLATIVGLLESTLIRIGNDEYARVNGSFGLTTMRTRHVRVDGPRLMFAFVGKGGKRYNIGVSSKRLARTVRALRELPGQELFQYVDDAGVARSIGSADVNDYLRETMGTDFTAKDFRTWRATVSAATLLARAGCAETASETKKMINAAIAATAERLGNTPAICRKSYVHPAVLEAYADGETVPVTTGAPSAAALEDLTEDERNVAALLRRRTQA